MMLIPHPFFSAATATSPHAHAYMRACALSCKQLPLAFLHQRTGPPAHRHTGTLAHRLTHPLSSQSGYVLYIVIVVLAIAVGLFSLAIRNTATVSIAASGVTHRVQARLLAESGISRAQYFLNGGDGHDIDWETDGLHEDVPGYGTIDLACRRFGLFARIAGTGTRIKSRYTMDALAGRNVPDSLHPVITITGSVRGLVLDSRSSISGQVVLDYGEVVRAGGRRHQPIRGSEQWCRNRTSPRLPFDITPIDSVLARLTRELKNTAPTGTAVSGNLTLTSRNDSLLRSGTLTVTNDCEIRDMTVRDAVIVAGGTITIGLHVNAAGAMFLAQRLVITEGATEGCLFFTEQTQRITGGTHDSQFFALDSILLGSKAHFGQLTAWISKRSVGKDSVARGGIDFEGNGQYIGTAICYRDSMQPESRLIRSWSIRLGDRADLTGTLITDGETELGEVNVHGRIWTAVITGVKGGKKGVHWLYNTRIEEAGMEPVFPLVGEGPLVVKMGREGKRR